jgi:hypothetical protein
MFLIGEDSGKVGNLGDCARVTGFPEVIVKSGDSAQNRLHRVDESPIYRQLLRSLVCAS